MREKLQEYALLAEIISAFAVIASLLFVGFEIRQSSYESSLNTKTIQASSFQSLVAQYNAVSFESMTNPEFAETLRQVYANEIPATLPIGMQVFSYLTYTALHSEVSFFQYSQELITKEQLQTMLRPLIANLATDVGKLHWDIQTELSIEFVSYLENLMRARVPTDTFWQE